MREFLEADEAVKSEDVMAQIFLCLASKPKEETHVEYKREFDAGKWKQSLPRQVKGSADRNGMVQV